MKHSRQRSRLVPSSAPHQQMHVRPPAGSAIPRRLAAAISLMAMLAFAIASCGGTATTPIASSAPTVTTVTAATTQPTASNPVPTAVNSSAGPSAATTVTAATTAAPIPPAVSTTAGSTLSGPFALADLVLSIDGQPFALLSDAAPLLKKLGDTFEKTEAESCVYEGFDKTFDYGFLQVFTIPKGKQDLVDGIYLVDDRYRTVRGIKVGDPAEAVVKAYGKPPSAEDYVYNQSGDPASLAEPNLTFIVEGGKVTAISFYSGSNAQGAASR